jgi:RimJ/RimL family protein N-acetyltransferase
MLVGEDVILRAFTPDDIQRVGELLNTPKTYGPHATFRFRPVRDLEKGFDEDGMLGMDRGHLILATNDSDLVGLCWYWSPVPGFDTREVQIMVPPAQVKESDDFEARALRLIVHYLYSSFPVYRVQTHVVVANTRGLAACEASGFSKEGEMRCSYMLRGEYINEVLLSVLRAEWAADTRYDRLRELFAEPEEPPHGAFGFVR